MCFPQGHLWLQCDIAPPGGGSAQDEVVDALRRWLDLFAAAGVEVAVLHPGGGALVRGGAERAEVLDARSRALRALVRHAGGALVIALENVPNAPTVEDLTETIEHAGGEGLGICLDTGHLNLTDEPQADFIRWCGPRLAALHLAENDKTGDQHNMPFARGGCVPWHDIAAALDDIRYTGLLNFEVPGENRCPLPVRRLKLAYLKDLAAWIFSPQAPAPPPSAAPQGT